MEDKKQLSDKAKLSIILSVISLFIIILIAMNTYNDAFGTTVTNKDLEFEYKIENEELNLYIKPLVHCKYLSLEVIYEGENGTKKTQTLKYEEALKNHTLYERHSLKTVEKNLKDSEIKTIYIKIIDGIKKNAPIPSVYITITSIFLTTSIIIAIIIIGQIIQKKLKESEKEKAAEAEARKESEEKERQAAEEAERRAAEELQRSAEEARLRAQEEERKIIEEQDKAFEEEIGKIVENDNSNYESNNKDKFYKKYGKPTLHCKDGHYVRSKAERDIDNFFYENKIIHNYEKRSKFSNGQKLYPDFYLPKYELYIEYFGMTTEDYTRNKDKKIKIYNSMPSLKVEYLTHEDDGEIYDKLKHICIKYNIPMR